MLKKSWYIIFVSFLFCFSTGCGNDSPTLSTAIPQPTSGNNISSIVAYLYLDQLNISGSDSHQPQIIVCDEKQDLPPVSNALIHCNDQQTLTNSQGQFELFEQNGEHEIIIDPSNSNNAQGCPPKKVTCSSKKQNSNEIPVDFKITPVNRTVPIGHIKDWELNFFNNNNEIVDNPAGAVWSVEIFENFPIVGTISQTGLFIATTPGEGTIQVTWNGLIRTAHVRVIKGDTSDTFQIIGNVSFLYNYLVSQNAEPIENAFIILENFENGAYTDPNGNYQIESIPIPPVTYLAEMSFQTYKQQQSATSTQPVTVINFIIEENITITPTPQPTAPIGIPTYTPLPANTPSPTGIPTPTNTPEPTATFTPAPCWHIVNNTSYPGDSLNDVRITNNDNTVNIVSADYYYRSIDRGQTYSIINPSTISGMRSIYFVNNNTGWITGNLGLLYKTTNSGDSWTAQNSSNGDTLFCVFFLDELNGWISGAKSTAQFTTDGGNNWNNRVTSPGFIDNNRSAEFIDMSNGFVVGTNGKIYKTTDQAVNWVLQIPTSENLNDIDMIDINNGWTVGNIGTILHTHNSGISWSTQTSNTSTELRGVSFYNADYGWAVGKSGTILRTVNGGNIWTIDTIATIENLNSIHAIGENEAWAVGANGTILHFY